MGTVVDFRDRCCGERDSEERPGESCIFRLSLRGLSLEFHPLHAFPVRPTLPELFFFFCTDMGVYALYMQFLSLYSCDATFIYKLQATTRQHKTFPIMTENI